MVRPKKYRFVDVEPEVVYYKPAGTPLAYLQEINLMIDELQTLVISDVDCLYQHQGAEIMGVSRQTFARILKSARQKVAEALSKGMAIRIEGGKVMRVNDEMECINCGHTWLINISRSSSSPLCPRCEGTEIRNISNKTIDCKEAI